MGADLEGRWEGAAGQRRTALVCAAEWGMVETVLMLLEEGADVFSRSCMRCSANLPAHCAQGNALAAAYSYSRDTEGIHLVRAVLQLEMDRRVAAALSAMPAMLPGLCCCEIIARLRDPGAPERG